MSKDESKPPASPAGVVAPMGAAFHGLNPAPLGRMILVREDGSADPEQVRAVLDELEATRAKLAAAERRNKHDDAYVESLRKRAEDAEESRRHQLLVRGDLERKLREAEARALPVEVLSRVCLALAGLRGRPTWAAEADEIEVIIRAALDKAREAGGGK